MSNSRSEEAVLSVSGLSKSFGGLRALEDISFEVRSGEILGLLGPNGAGKTTFFNVISGVLAPDKGSVLFLGEETSGFPSHRMACRGIGRTYQIVRPFGALSVRDNVLAAMGLHAYQGCVPLFSFWNTGKNRKTARKYLKMAGLESLEESRADTLPLGSLRRLELARALALEPRLLLLDETFSGLRHQEIEALKKTILDIRKEGISILLIEHNMRVAMSLSDRIVVLDHGRKIAEGSPEGVSRNEEVINAYLGRVEHHGIA